MSDDEDNWRERDAQARRELEQIRLQMDATTDKSLESTRNMVSMVHEASDQGATTMVMLNEQGEQIRRTGERLDEAHEELQQATKNLDDLEKCCGCCVLPWKLGRRRKQHSKTKTYDGINSKTESQREKELKKELKLRKKEEKKKRTDSIDNNVNDVGAGGDNEDYIVRITNDDREDEMNRNIGEVDKQVQVLKEMSKDMYKEVTRQNKDLDVLRDKATVLDDEVHHADKRARKIVRDN